MNSEHGSVIARHRNSASKDKANGFAQAPAAGMAARPAQSVAFAAGLLQREKLAQAWADVPVAASAPVAVTMGPYVSLLLIE